MSANANFNALNIGHANVFHLCNKLHDVCRLLNGSPPLHLLGLSETRLGVQPDSQVFINNYHFFRKDAKLPGEVGLGIYVHKDITQFVTRRVDLESEGVECMWLQFKRTDKDSALLVSFVYRNPAATYAWYDDFVRMMDVVTNRHPKANFIIMGDFNIDFLKPQPSWKSTVSLHGLTQLVSQPTRITPTSSTLLDHIYVNNTDRISNIQVSDVSISDHCPILCSWSCKIPKPAKSYHTTIQYRCFKRFDKNVFLADLSCTNFANIHNCINPNDALNMFYDMFMPIVDRHAPLRRKRVKHQTVPGWMNADLVNAMKLRDKLKKDKKFDEYKKQRNLVSSMVKSAKQEYIVKMVGDNYDTAHIWRAVNEITHKSKHSKQSSSLAASPEDFNEHFLSVGKLVDPTSASQPGSKERNSLLAQFCKDRLQPADSFLIPEIAVHEVGKYICGLKNKKSMGLDNTNAFLLKLALPYIVESLTHIYNLCIKTNLFPDAWKSAKVIPLPKNNDGSDLNNFRPISILSVLSKPLEKHVHKHLSNFIEDKNLFYEYQSGFRKHHSCATAVTRLCDTWLSAINKSQICGAVFLDLKKAFDLVDHKILLEKLLLYTRSEATVSFIHSFLLNRSQCVVINANYSSLRPVVCGVPQGSVLGPLLFCLYINDMPLYIQNPNVCCELFADDGSLHSSSNSVENLEVILQSELNNVVRWSLDNHMILNPQKTKSMVITSRQKHQRAPLHINLSIGSASIDQVDSHRVLGVTVDNELRWQPHINNVCKTVSRNLYLLGKLSYYVDADICKSFFYAHCLSHINYASNVWCHASENLLKRLNSLHRRAAKFLAPSPFLSTDDKLKSAQVLSLNNQFNFNIAVLVFKVKNGLAPAYMERLLVKANGKYEFGNFILPRTRIDLYKSSFAFSGASVWNSLPAKVKSSQALSTFKSGAKKHFLRKSS